MRIGIDLGGTKIEGILMDTHGIIHTKKRIATPRGNYQHILSVLKTLIDELDTQHKATIGIASPGSESAITGLMRNANTTELNGKAFSYDLSTLVQRPVRIENDANCFALSEAIDGSATGKESVFGVIIGTGTGAGIVIHGKILSGKNRIAGEWGHNPMPFQKNVLGRPCYCGKKDCVETYLSGPGFSRTYQELTTHYCTAEEIVILANAGDSLAQKALNIYACHLAQGLSQIINILDPDTIVLGGGMSNITELYKLLPPLLLRYCFSETIKTEILPPTHGDSSGVRGAAWLWA